MQKKLAVFDVDGTLTDSVAVHQAAFILALEQTGLKGFDTNWNNYTEHTDSFIFKTIFEDQMQRSIADSDMEDFENALLGFIENMTQRQPVCEIKGARFFLDQLDKLNDVDIVFATGSLRKPAHLKLRQADIPINNELLVCANTIFVRDELVAKAIQQAKEHYGVSHYDQVFSFGDGIWDLQTAQSLSIDFVGINSEKLGAMNLTHYYPDFTHPSLHKHVGIRVDPVFNFRIASEGEVSNEFKQMGMHDFQAAAAFIRDLPYGRNADKHNLLTVFTDGRGTCSTKHALLKLLAMENDQHQVELSIGLFKMNPFNTPEVGNTLRQYNLEYIPEAHCYLRVGEEIIDVTKAHSKPSDFVSDLIEETDILPDQITDYKVAWHQKYLRRWLSENIQIPLTFESLWQVREMCIADLAS